MSASEHVSVRIDLGRIRANTAAVRDIAGVALLAVVKSDAYGLGVERVAPVIADLVDGYCFFSFAEAADAALWRKLGKASILLGPPRTAADVPALRRRRIRPVVSSVEDARHWRGADPILSVDLGMQRFACPPGHGDEALRAGSCREAMTHAVRAEQAVQLKQMLGNRGLRLHAAASALLHEPAARLDAVRPGIALYQGSVRVATHLVEVRDSNTPAGYTGFVVPRHGVILAGYAQGLRKGPCRVNGRAAHVLEVGMQSAFVECGAGDRVGDEVVLLGEGLSEQAVAYAWGVTPHCAMLCLAGAGIREYV